MPVHDWTNVDANVFHHFHQAWTMSMCNALNAGLLARVLGLGGATRRRHCSGCFGLGKTIGLSNLPERILTATPPKTRIVRHAKATLARRGNRIVIRHRMGEIVCVVELVSPGNKSGRAALRAFVQKSIDYLSQGIHLLVIDILPPTTRDPQGIYKAIWDEIDEEEFELPPDKKLTLAAFVAGDNVTGIEPAAYVETVGVGDVLPDMPAYLDRSGYLPMPLEATYQTAWQTCRLICDSGWKPGNCLASNRMEAAGWRGHRRQPYANHENNQSRKHESAVDTFLYGRQGVSVPPLLPATIERPLV